MANYITHEVLSEAYTHLDIDIFHDKEKLEKLRQDLTNFYRDRASFLFGSDVEIKVHFEEGSLRTRIVAFGSAALMMGTVIAGYGSFREGITQLANDAVTLAQAANLEVIFHTKTPYCDRIRVEKRKGVFGRVSALLNELDSVAGSVGVSRLPTNSDKLKEASIAIDNLLIWNGNVDTLFTKFDGPETEACVAEGLLEELKLLPSRFPWHVELSQDKFRNQIMVADPVFAGDVAATAIRYETLYKAIRKNLNNRLEQSLAKQED